MDQEFLFNHINTKHHTYLTNFLDKYFKRGKFNYNLKHFTSRTSYTGTHLNNNSCDEHHSNFLKTSKQNKRTRTGYKKPNRFQVRLELYFCGNTVIKQSASSSDEKGAEIRAYTKFFRKIVNYYSKSDYNVINLLLKA